MFLKNLISIIIPFVLSATILFVFNAYTPVKSGNAAYGLLFFVVLFFILNLVYALQAKSKTLTELLMAGIVIKLLLALVVIVIYSVIDQPGLFNFAIHFMIYYILFTIFEIRYLFRIIKINSTQNYHEI